MTKKTTSLLSAALLAATLGTAALPSQAAIVTVDVAPPAPRYEAVPAPRHGYNWTAGYWNWNGHRYLWVPGTWVRERHGYYYTEPSWAEHDVRWVLQRGHWMRGERDHDRDHDGVPNRYDHDRDNDGVPNQYDRHPDNPYRH